MIKILRSKKIIYLVLIVFITSSYTLMYQPEIPGKNSPVTNGVPDSLGSQKAFLAAYDVLMSPRCMNCHPKGDVPLQGDDSHLHTQGVIRGVDGKGVYALKCSNCHQPKNTPGLHMPPGNPNWHLPPADMKMVFEGKTPRELAAQLKDPNRNGHKTMQQLIDHVTSDKLVLGGWDPGDGRKRPPLSHDVFAKKFKEWIDKGAYLPTK
ncbi:hypothetical protein BH11BAC3_BH11BAC3_00880 [soil metagenome]